MGKNNMLPRICRQCGKSFLGGPRAWYCPQCREERARKANAEHKQRKKAGNSRIIGEKYRCIDCGAEYILSCGLQVRCPECAQKHLKEIDNQQSQEWKEANREKYLEAKRSFDKRRRAEVGKPTGEKYITFDKANRKYRLVIKGKHIGYYDDIQEAIKVRDSLLDNE